MSLKELPLTVTNRALEEIQAIRKNKQIPQPYGLRIGVKGGGCGGMTYLLGFDTRKEDDVTYDLNNIDIHIAKKHTMYLLGLTLDFYEGADTRGFMFLQPGQQADPVAGSG